MKVHSDKANMGLNLVELEAAGHAVQNELIIANTIHEATGQMDALALENIEEEK